MSTNIYNQGDFIITSYWGGEEDGKRLQFSAGAGGYSTFSKEEIIKIINVLNNWVVHNHKT